MLGRGGKLLTYDFFSIAQRGCTPRSGVYSAIWERLVTDGIVEPRVADITAPAEIEYVRQLARSVNSSGPVLFIDDGDHLATPLIVHFLLFSDLVLGPRHARLTQCTHTLPPHCTTGRGHSSHRSLLVCLPWSLTV